VAAEFLKLDLGLRQILRTPARAGVSLPTKMDNGQVKVFTAPRAAHVSRGPGKGGIPSIPTSRWTK